MRVHQRSADAGVLADMIPGFRNIELTRGSRIDGRRIGDGVLIDQLLQDAL
jgi:hypothetical protein